MSVNKCYNPENKLCLACHLLIWVKGSLKVCSKIFSCSHKADQLIPFWQAARWFMTPHGKKKDLFYWWDVFAATPRVYQVFPAAPTTTGTNWPCLLNIRIIYVACHANDSKRKSHWEWCIFWSLDLLNHKHKGCLVIGAFSAENPKPHIKQTRTYLYPSGWSPIL